MGQDFLCLYCQTAPPLGGEADRYMATIWSHSIRQPINFWVGCYPGSRLKDVVEVVCGGSTSSSTGWRHVVLFVDKRGVLWRCTVKFWLASISVRAFR